MKRVISWLLAFALLLMLAMPVAMATDVRKSGLFSYTMKGNGTAIIVDFDDAANGSRDVYIPAQIDGYTVSEIGEQAFKDTRSKCIIMLPETITTIGEKAFANSAFTSVNIPSSVKVISNNAFSSMANLKKLTVDSKNPVYASIDGVLYHKQTKTLVAYPFGGEVEASIPSGIHAIGKGAFQNIKRLDVTMPSTLSIIDDYAFAETVLGEILIPDFVETIGQKAFWGCELYMSQDGRRILYLPSSVKALGISAFENCMDSHYNRKVAGYYYIHLGDTQLTEISDRAFAGVASSNTKAVYLPTTLTRIGNDAFAKVNIGTDGLILPKKVASIGNHAFANGKGRIRFAAFSELKSIGKKAFLNFDFNGLNGVLTLPDGLESIGEEAFAGVKGIEKIVIPASVNYIGNDICDRANIVLDVESGSYAEFWASENGYLTTIEVDDLSWLEADVGANTNDTIVLKEGVYVGEGRGLNGNIKVQVTVMGGAISSIEVIKHDEVPGIGDKAFEKLIAEILLMQSVAVDCVAGSTHSSQGFIEAVNNALEQMEGK